MIWFVIGAAVGGASAFIRSRGAPHPYQGIAVAAAFGAVVFGAPLWLLSKAF